MTKKVITVEPDCDLNGLEQIFRAKPIHHILVTSRGVLKGVISKNDLLRFYQEQHGTNGVKVEAHQVMVADPMTVEPEDSIGLVADVMLANKFHSLPVVEDDELVGIVTNHDLIMYAYQ